MLNLRKRDTEGIFSCFDQLKTQKRHLVDFFLQILMSLQKLQHLAINVDGDQQVVLFKHRLPFSQQIDLLFNNQQTPVE